MIKVTKPYLPPLDEYCKCLNEIWDSECITNNGPLLVRLELQLKAFLNVENLLIVSSGTLGLQIAIAALDLSGEIITTAFSHAATVNSIIWNGIQPVFVDIEQTSLCIDPDLIEAAITEKTSAILCTHVFGNPCNVDKIRKIAQKYSLRVIYDGAHAFGVRLGGHSIFNCGDISVVSFHATKFYHMVEGGAIFCKDQAIFEKCNLLRNFGLRQVDDYVMAGTNAKNSELHAAMGLCNLPNVPGFISKRKELSELYISLLDHLPLQFPEHSQDVDYNYAYFAVIFPSEEKMMMVKDVLEQNSIYPRRYFYPSLNKLVYTNGSACPVGESISTRILCLPLYHDLTACDVRRIASLIAQQL